ncbi:uncharacterized protein LOC119667094 [Teleopsis dalmanni]|uniref:uncharacterized protein LOC119667094 n=1 Tax=Teleopsis dalmanni TaxID=139649 RepID=UPI0018CF66F9|nr:uncharacterized protein LOC119667094 [Teleopsis dalmanni]
MLQISTKYYRILTLVLLHYLLCYVAAENSTARNTTTKVQETAILNFMPQLSTTITNSSEPYCEPSLCEFYNGTHINQMPHIACHNNGEFGPACGVKPRLLDMNERRRNLILDMHNLARSRIASGELEGYKPASHMPLLKWDTELEHLAMLHVKRCQFAHDQCRNTPNYLFSGQNIGYFWIGREFKSHSKRMKAFILNWFKEYRDADQTFIDSYHPHPERKKIGHFTLMVADRTHRVGCAAVRYREPSQPDDVKFLMTCNYDFTNIIGEPIYQTGRTASKCTYQISEKYPNLCDWKTAVYEYDENDDGENNLLNNNIPYNMPKTLHLIFLTASILAVVLQQSAATDYCSSTLCGSGRTHVACGNTGAFASTCASDANIISMTTTLQNALLDKHNTLRNTVAAGNLSGYTAAKRMATIVWDAELAMLAELNVKQCAMKHDQCRNTDKFKLAGQNLAYSGWSGTTKEVQAVSVSHVQMWFDEYKDCSMTYINNYSNPTNGKVIGHFTQVVQEKATSMGCAILRQTKNGFTEQYTACNYAYTNVINRPVYTSGTAASACTSGKDATYKSLCSTAEVYNVNS